MTGTDEGWTEPPLPEPPGTPATGQDGALPSRTLPPFSPHETTIGIGDGGTVPPETSEPGVLASLEGSWSGSGLNVIWTPSEEAKTGSDRFLQLAATVETQDYAGLGGSIPNRGLAQQDLFMAGSRYTQQISSNGKAVHFEHGVWLNVPATSVPPVEASVARMASIPHGTTINAQGTVEDVGAVLDIPVAPISPFSPGNPASRVRLSEQDLATATSFRTPDPALIGFDQQTLDDVNAFLRSNVPTEITSVTVIRVSSAGAMPGGGVANTAFLGPNATTSAVDHTVWLCTVAGGSIPTVMLYSQTVLLDFAGLSWPHVTVGVLQRAPAASA